mmetsp:Transcript_64026/g.183905  ORF Transcript_64026/g.183905 Transcript_64026/m.183905 type:complete len:334 (-) Transcript_64026:127-1128(-)
MGLGDLVLAEMARPSNCATDLLLCVIHLAFLARQWKLQPISPHGYELRALAASYSVVCIIWQAQGAWNHLFNPIPSTMTCAYFIYLALGALCPSLYGVAISADIQPSPHAIRRCQLAFAFMWVLYVALAAVELDLADHFPLPRTQELTISPTVVSWLPAQMIPWLPHAVAASGGPGHPVTLRWDGRGYGAVPFEHAFSADAVYAERFDLIAGHPCWKVHSFPFLFLVFGLGLNCAFTAKTLGAYRRLALEDMTYEPYCAASRRRSRFFWWFVAHGLTTTGVAFMPVAMLFTGVSGGIDWMHCVMIPAMYLQCWGLEDAVLSSIEEAKNSKKAS